MTALICTYYTHTSMKNTVTIIWQITTHTVQYSRSFLKRNLYCTPQQLTWFAQTLCLFSENSSVYTAKTLYNVPQFSKSSLKSIVFCLVTSLRRQSRLYLRERDHGKEERIFALRKSSIIPSRQQQLSQGFKEYQTMFFHGHPIKKGQKNAKLWRTCQTPLFHAKPL